MMFFNIAFLIELSLLGAFAGSAFLAGAAMARQGMHRGLLAAAAYFGMNESRARAA
jgi:hypothetical protein